MWLLRRLPGAVVGQHRAGHECVPLAKPFAPGSPISGRISSAACGFVRGRSSRTQMLEAGAATVLEFLPCFLRASSPIHTISKSSIPPFGANFNPARGPQSVGLYTPVCVVMKK